MADSYMNITNVEDNSMPSSESYILDGTSYTESHLPTPESISIRSQDVLLGKLRAPKTRIASDVLMHAKDDDTQERIVFPITRYANILTAPTVLNDISEYSGEPFVFLKTGYDELTTDEINTIMGGKNYNASTNYYGGGSSSSGNNNASSGTTNTVGYGTLTIEDIQGVVQVVDGGTALRREEWNIDG